MSSGKDQVSIDRITDILGSISDKGVRFWLENGELHYKAPKGALTRQEVEKLRASKAQIFAFFERAARADTFEPRLESLAPLHRAPLAFSQLAHWNLYQLNERRSIRQIASATRLRGRLNIEALKIGLAEIVRRHDALRARIIVRDGVPIQEISQSGDHELIIDDISTIPQSMREAQVASTIEQHILHPIDVAIDPLFGSRLLRLCDDEHVLILSMEHMISDEVSMNIFMRELFTAYMQVAQGRVISLPAVSMQLTEYAVWQRNMEESWKERCGTYWNEHLTACKRLRFPDNHRLNTVPREGWETVPIHIERDLKQDLIEWSRQRQTTIVMSVFTAYVALVLRWCGARDAVIQFVTDGRVSQNLQNTIGYLASVLHIRISLREEDRFVDLMNRVKDEYCRAQDTADFSYLAAQVPRPEFTRGTAFNWIPASKIEAPQLSGTEDTITCSPVPFSHPMLKKIELDSEPSILLFDTEDGVVGGVGFPLNRMSADAMEGFVHNFLAFIRILLKQPEKHVTEILLV